MDRLPRGGESWLLRLERKGERFGGGEVKVGEKER